jgi:hypothetical protein
MDCAVLGCGAVTQKRPRAAIIMAKIKEWAVKPVLGRDMENLLDTTGEFIMFG